MKNKTITFFAIAALFTIPTIADAPKEVPLDKANEHYNQTITITGKIIITDKSDNACFLNFNKDPNKDCPVIISTLDLPKFPPNPEKHYLNKEVKITGLVKKYQQKPAIVIKNPSQIQIIEKVKPASTDKKEKAVKIPDANDEKPKLNKQIETLTTKITALEKTIADLEKRIQKLEVLTAPKPQPVREPPPPPPTKIQNGMGKADVLRLYGRPEEIKSYTILGTDYEEWQYRDFRQVEFENGKVRSFHGF